MLEGVFMRLTVSSSLMHESLCGLCRPLIIDLQLSLSLCANKLRHSHRIALPQPKPLPPKFVHHVARAIEAHRIVLGVLQVTEDTAGMAGARAVGNAYARLALR